MKYSDMNLEEPITGDKYQVQVKSQACLSEFTEYAKNFDAKLFRKLYFVVHSPTKDLKSHPRRSLEHAELVLTDRLAKMTIDAGLVGWLMKKVR